MSIKNLIIQKWNKWTETSFDWRTFDWKWLNDIFKGDWKYLDNIISLFNNFNNWMGILVKRNDDSIFFIKFNSPKNSLVF